MFIILEGPDGAGKSTVFDAIIQLHKRDSASYVKPTLFHHGPPRELTRSSVLQDYVAAPAPHISPSTPVFADRWHWGERTYASIFRPKTNIDGFGLLGKAGWRWVELYLMSRGALQVAIVPSLRVLEERVGTRGDEMVDTSHLEAIRQAYVDVVTATPPLVYKPLLRRQTVSALDQFADDLLAEGLRRSRAVSHLGAYPKYIGNPRPSVLLVGDTVNISPGQTFATDIPFAPVSGNSAEFLLSSLPDDIWQTVGVVNANDCPPADLYALWHVLGRPPITALGHAAYTTLVNKAEIPDKMIYFAHHPQYTRRFAHNTREAYGMDITKTSISRKGTN